MIDLTICNDGFVAEINSDEDFDKMMKILFGGTEEEEEIIEDKYTLDDLGWNWY